MIRLGEKKEFRLLQIPRWPLELDDEIKILAIKKRQRYTQYIIDVLREHVEQEKRREKRR